MHFISEVIELIELTKDQQWERLNYLLSLIAAILAMNATVLFIWVIFLSLDSSTFKTRQLHDYKQKIKGKMEICKDINYFLIREKLAYFEYMLQRCGGQCRI